MHYAGFKVIQFLKQSLCQDNVRVQRRNYDGGDKEDSFEIYKKRKWKKKKKKLKQRNLFFVTCEKIIRSQ